MSKIKMDPQDLQTKANKYGVAANEIRSTLQSLQNLQNELRQQWEGRAFDQFDVQFDQLSSKTQEFASLLDDIKNQLIQTARAMQEYDQALANNFGLK